VPVVPVDPDPPDGPPVRTSTSPRRNDRDAHAGTTGTSGSGSDSGAVGIGFPVVLDLTGRPCLVVGGGPIASRRALAMMAAGGRVTVVAPQLTQSLEGTVGITIERRRYRHEDANGYDLVATATGDLEVDRMVVADANAAGALAVGADSAAPGTISLPAVHHQGRVTLAVSTGGSSPALARWLLGRAVATLPREVDLIATLLEETRARLQAAGRATDSVDWTAVLDTHVVPLVEAGRVDDARDLLGRL
jgi:siroheme synthase-like protein